MVDTKNAPSNWGIFYNSYLMGLLKFTKPQSNCKWLHVYETLIFIE
jgi:hypothetical protein